MTKVSTADICVIGGGAGGFALAAAAASFGASVILVDREGVLSGGLRHGALPARTLAAAARRIHIQRKLAVSAGVVPPDVDFKNIQRQIGDVAASVAPVVSAPRLAALGVRFVKGEARFRSRRLLSANGTDIRAKRYVIATGSVPDVPPIQGLDQVEWMTTDSIFSLARLPGHLVVLGSDPVGLELAQAFRRLGSAVTVVHEGEALPGEDAEMAGVVVGRLRAEGVAIMPRRRILSVERRGKTGVTVQVEGDEGSHAIEGSHLLVAMGRRPDLGPLDLGRAKVAFDAKGIDVSAMLRTTNRRIYAIGEAAGSPGAAHVAAYQASLVLRPLLFSAPGKPGPQPVPRVTFTEPELAHVGMSEDEARGGRRGKVRVLRWSFAENDRAQAEGATAGHIKIVTGAGGSILGVSIVGAAAGELIALWSLAISRGLTVRDMAEQILPYPTYGEIGKRAAITYFSKATGSGLVRGWLRTLRLFR